MHDACTRRSCHSFRRTLDGERAEEEREHVALPDGEHRVQQHLVLLERVQLPALLLHLRLQQRQLLLQLAHLLGEGPACVGRLVGLKC